MIDVGDYQADWLDKDGKMAVLHQVNWVRLNYIQIILI